tara:strand:- start:468 stop:1706 length:1239 start_codon:yes stop_codon:yes gene_type:complete
MKLYKVITIIFLSQSIYANSIVIKGGLIHSGNGLESFQADILIEDQRIVKIGKNLSKSNARVIEANGSIVTPGLISPLSNIGVVEINALDVTKDDEPDIFGPGFSVFHAFNPKSTLIPWNRSNGVTSAIASPGYSSGFFKGMGSFFILDGELDIKGIPDVAMYARLGARNGSRSETIQIMESLLEISLQYDGTNVEDILDINLVDSLELQANDILALHSVVRDKLPLVLEVNRASDILQALRLKAKFKLNLVLLSAEEAPLVLDEIIKADVPIIIDPMDNIPDSFDELASNIELGGILDQAGINLMFSTQRSHNYHLMRQGAGNAVAYGMSYGTAIQGMTKNVADTFGLSGRGLIAEGNYADIVVWDQDPLEPSSFPKYVLINGKIQDLTTRSSRLTDRYKSSSDKPSAYKY